MLELLLLEHRDLLVEHLLVPRERVVVQLVRVRGRCRGRGRCDDG